jgi:hypothetical protein
MTEGLDGRHRDESGRISEKHGSTLVSTLREEYGKHFLADWPDHATLEQVREKTGKSLTHLLKEHHEKHPHKA